MDEYSNIALESTIVSLNNRIATLEQLNDTLSTVNNELEATLTKYETVMRMMGIHGVEYNTSKSAADYQKHIERVGQLHVKGKHLEILEGAIRDNESVRNAWDQLTIMLRLCGYDGNNQ